jgi:putative ABC transport system substrate-binding protein
VTRSRGWALAPLLALALFASVASAQPARQVRLGWLSLTESPDLGIRQGLQDGLRELGWLEGRDYVLERRSADGKNDRLPALAAELLKGRPDVLLATGTVPARALQQATKTIPIVCMTGDPVAAGLVNSLARPGGNVTGFAITPGSGQLPAKQLDLLKTAAPRLSRVAYIHNPANPSSAVARFAASAQALRLEIVPFEITSPAGMEATLEAIRRARVDGLMTDGDPTTEAQYQRLAEFSLRHRLPGAFGRRTYVAAGGLMSYGPNLGHTWKRAAVVVDKIVKGATPADIPVEEPTKFDLVVNLKAATALGLTLPPTLILRADEVIQ